MMPFHTIDSGAAGPSALVIAGVHGDEYEPIWAVHELHRRLQGQLLKGKLVLVPVVNTTAVNQHTRCGIDGLDLARICPGDIVGSASETDAAAVSSLIRSADFLVDLHTGGRIFQIYPMTGYMLHPDINILEQQRRMARAFGLPVIWGTDPAPNGRTLSVARDIPIPSIYVEYGGGATVNPAIARAYVDGCIGVLQSYGMLAGLPSVSNPEYWVEDPTPNQGHLQVKMPSPADGIFIPAVSIGQWIEKEQHWGDVFDVESGLSTPVKADDTGLVLFLRTDAIVQKNDSLGGILTVTHKR